MVHCLKSRNIFLLGLTSLLASSSLAASPEELLGLTGLPLVGPAGGWKVMEARGQGGGCSWRSCWSQGSATTATGMLASLSWCVRATRRGTSGWRSWARPVHRRESRRDIRWQDTSGSRRQGGSSSSTCSSRRRRKSGDTPASRRRWEVRRPSARTSLTSLG